MPIAGLVRLALFIVISVSAVAVGACEAPPGRHASADDKFGEGRVTGPLPAAPPEAVRAVEWAIKDMGFTHVSSRDSAESGLVRGRTGDGEEIEVTITRSGEGRSECAILFGAFGDEPLSRALLKRVRDRLAL